MKGSRIFLTILLALLAAAGTLNAQVQIDSVTSTPTTCGTLDDGTISAYVSGGTGWYNYSLFRGATFIANSGYTSNTNHTFAGLGKSFLYIIIVEDGDPVVGFANDNAVVTGPNPVTITSSIPTDITCNSLNNGTITVTATGEDGAFDFLLAGPMGGSNQTGIFTGLTDGDYTVTVTPQNGCPSSDVTPVMTINRPDPISITVESITDVLCFGDNTGDIDISVTGGTPFGSGPPYIYAWSSVGGYSGSTEDISGLAADSYSVTVTDANGCTANQGGIDVTEPTQLNPTLDGTTDATCNGYNDGTASMTPGGGVGPYTYSWDGQFTGLISTDEDPVNLVADTYDFTLFDSNGCSRTLVSFATIGEPDPLNITVVATTDASCNGFSDGSADITPSGGTLPYTFLWTGSTSGYSSTETDPTAMPADDFSVTITDDNSCSRLFTDLLTIGEPDPINVVLNGTTDATCFGGADGSADIAVSGGTPVYSFSWTGDVTGHSSTLEDPNDLVMDTYDLIVTDNNGCIETYNNLATIDEPADITVNVDNITHVDCSGESTGAIDITPGGGTSPYTFAWTGPGGYSSSSRNISGLATGDYSVTITDSQGCIKVFTNVATVNTNDPIDAIFTITPVTCNGGSDGAINATVSGGTPVYTYSWSGPGGFSASTEDISGRIAGSYQLTVTDALGCVEVLPSQAISEPPAIGASASVTDIDCFGSVNGSIDLTPSGGVPPYTFAWTGPGGPAGTTEDISGLGAGSYSVTVSDANGCSTLFTDIASVSEPPEIQTSHIKTDISCNGLTDGAIDLTVTGGTPPLSVVWTGPGGFNSTSEDISGLAAGSYSVTVTDGNGCVVNFPALVDIIEPGAIAATWISQVDILCNGDLTGSIEIDVTGGTAPLVFDWTNSSGTTVSTDEDPTGLAAGTYSLSISDAGGCVADYPDLATLTEPPVLSASLAGVDIQCYGDGNGTITVTASGGTPGYEYSRTGDFDPSYQPGNVFSGLGPGLYTIWTRDASRCTTSDTITINEPEEIQVLGETKSGQNLCHGDSSATITIDNVIGGVLPYQYSINGGTDYSASNAFSNLPAGNYQTVVRDATGCEATGNLNVITHPTSLQIDSYFQEDITTCYDAAEGRIVISGTGGTGIKSYILNDTLTILSGDFQNLPAGPHKVTIEDQNGCTLDTMVVILATPEIVVDNILITHITGCAGDGTGEVTISGSGGSGSIEYAIDGGGYQPAGTFTGLLAGNHTLTLKDDNDCTRDTVITINEPAPITIISEQVTPITCATASDGMIELVVTGGTAPLSFTLNPGSETNGTGQFGGLAPDTYIISVDDAQGCGPVDSNPVTLVSPPALLVDSVVDENIACFGASDGTISIYASGGVPPYQYSVDNQANWASDSVITGLGPGTYDVFIRDANLCVVPGGSFTMSDPPELTLSVTTNDVTTCAGDSAGSIEATGGGGTGLLEYSVDGINFQASGNFMNLPGGTYTVYLQDETGCSLTEPAEIQEPEPVTATIEKTDATFGNLGSITISDPAGGTPPYEYTIGGPTGTFSSETFYGDLTAAVYHVIVRDASGCFYEEMVDILDIIPLDVVVNVTNVSCFGADDGSIEMVPQDAEGAVVYSIDSGQNFVDVALFENLPGNTTYYLVARDTAGKIFTGSAPVNEPSELFFSRSITPAECNVFSETGAIDITVTGGTGGYSFQWSDGSTDEDRNNIVTGFYIVETTDSSSCTRIDTVEVNSLVIVDAYAGEDTSVCHGSVLQLTGQGGHIPSWSPVDFLSDPDVANPVAGPVTVTTTYVLTISEETSPYGCYNTDSVTITVMPLTGLDVTADTFIVKGTSIQLGAEGGLFTDWLWEPGTGLDNTTIPDPIASPLESVRYTLYATNENGCVESDSVYIEVIEDLRAYNVFTPNGDGTNDYFDIENASRFPEMVVEVYSRWGDQIFSSVGYDDSKRWDGTARGKEAPVGTYYYVIIPYSGATPITGNVTIIR